jgi:hypothetical protein
VGDAVGLLDAAVDVGRRSRCGVITADDRRAWKAALATQLLVFHTRGAARPGRSDGRTVGRSAVATDLGVVDAGR